MRVQPFQTLKHYNKKNLPKDILAGIIIMAVSIPISMGYAQIAGLPAVYGLYGSVFPIILFGLFSTSPQFIFGVDAAPAALVGSAIVGLGIESGTKEAMAAVPVLTFFVALWLLAFYFMKAGKLVNFISAPVMGGFITGICTTIILMQVPKLMGGTAGVGELFELAEHIAETLKTINLPSLVIGLTALFILLVSKKVMPKFPMAVALMAAGALMTLITGNAPGNDMRFYWERVEASRNFANKVWNASRFIMMNLEGSEIKEPSLDELKPADKWILSKVNTLAKDVTENMDKYEMGIAVQKVYDFIWDEFCDWYIEITKTRTYNKENDPASANAAFWTLKTVLTEALKLLHPFMPFITEEIFCTLHPEEDTIMLAKWPEYRADWNFPAEEEMLEHCKDLVKGVRNLRTEMDVPPSRKAKIFIVAENAALRDSFELTKEAYANLAGASEVMVQQDKTGIGEDAVSVVIPGATLYLPLEDLVDFEKEKGRLLKEQARLEKELARSKGMLSNEKFLSKAPEAKVQEEKDKLAGYEQMMEQVKERLAQMSK